MFLCKVYIRPLKREDAYTSYNWRNIPEIWQYTGNRPDKYITPEIELEWIDKALADTACRRFAICVQENDQYIGNVQLTNIENESAIFGIFIGEKSFWGKGVASQATAQLIDYVKSYLTIAEIRLSVHPDNIAAQKAYSKNGFVAVDSQINMILKLK